MSEAKVPESVTIPALPEQVRVARAFVAGVLGRSHPHADLALLLASELVTNSVRHSGSAAPGGLVMVTVAAGRLQSPLLPEMLNSFRWSAASGGRAGACRAGSVSRCGHGVS
nr:ATP-binding protein [Actinomycetota bacterium]